MRGFTRKMSDKAYRSKEVLSDLYWGQRMTQREIAEELDCGAKTVDTWMRKLGVPSRNRTEITQPDPEELEIKHWQERKTQEELAEHYGVSQTTIWRWMRKNDIPQRGYGKGKEAVDYGTTKRGYEVWKTSVDYDMKTVAVHQLLAICKGYDADKVFSNGEYHCHHKNGIRWDNRLENVELKTASQHISDHNKERFGSVD